ncbi:aminotransferase class V-fold PLP-dependent enzyme [Bacillus idriensis]|uniref:Aminotransferase class V-fold PLP-dependent enzyme n=1 Tax=Metabacillus idriensis TaxID=324768 RepID=A0A6I2MGL1_9BACI|nr:IscS subfamily cysteine desulfurase [Metabacillus idriensis]MRX56929.1 aminotransferase class V-fold PLP-dependent enzyme [Metabacillus idriensis]
MIYLDYAATTPISDEALHVFAEASKKAFANSNSLHDEGDAARTLLEACRGQIADLIGGNASGVCFTGGGSEANVLAIETLLKNSPKHKNHIIASALEHSSIYNYLLSLEQKGYEVTFLLPDKHGKLHVEAIRDALTEQTALVSIQHANSEIGCIQNLENIGYFLHDKPVYFHSDCVQSFGKIPIKANAWKVDAISVSSHKVYGPKGVGGLYLNPRKHLTPVLSGGTHENGFRAGTVNVPGIAAFTYAAAAACSVMQTEFSRLESLKKRFSAKLSDYREHVHMINKDLDDQLPTIIGLVIRGIEGQYMLLEANRRGLAISTGTACQIGMQTPSKALMAIGLTSDEALQYIRISTGKHTNAEDLDKMAVIIEKAINERYMERRERLHERR